MVNLNLNNFLELYFQLLEKQLNEVQSSLTNAVSKVMTNVQELSTGKVTPEDTKKTLLSMVGTLSMDDVISQRMEHVSLCIEALQYHLAPLFLDFDTQHNDENIARIQRELFDYTEKVYSIPDEKKLFKEVFKNKKAA